MESPLQISKLNDFIFCPHSIYFHNLYGNYNESVFHDTPQQTGKIKHESIDKKIYSTSRDILQGIEIYCENLNLIGKIDIFNKKTGELIERKAKINKIYDGYILQLQVQYFCLREMGYKVKSLSLHSLVDNKRYPVPMPTSKDLAKLKKLIKQIDAFDPASVKNTNLKKCQGCIYKELCA